MFHKKSFTVHHAPTARDNCKAPVWFLVGALRPTVIVPGACVHRTTKGETSYLVAVSKIYCDPWIIWPSQGPIRGTWRTLVILRSNRVHMYVYASAVSSVRSHLSCHRLPVTPDVIGSAKQNRDTQKRRQSIGWQLLQCQRWRKEVLCTMLDLINDIE